MTSTRGGYSLIEVALVVGVMAMLSGMAAPGIFRALRQGSVNQVALEVKQTAEQAQALAMRTGADTFVDLDGGAWGDGLGRCYGVRITPASGSQPATVVMLRGDQPIGPVRVLDDAVDLRQWDGAPPAIVTDTTALRLCSAPIEWWYAWRTGRPTADPAGRSPLPRTISLTAATRDYQIQARGGRALRTGAASDISVYRSTGVVRAQ